MKTSKMTIILTLIQADAMPGSAGTQSSKKIMRTKIKSMEEALLSTISALIVIWNI